LLKKLPFGNSAAILSAASSIQSQQKQQQQKQQQPKASECERARMRHAFQFDTSSSYERKLPRNTSWIQLIYDPVDMQLKLMGFLGLFVVS
jgi:hypothetical protein